MNKNTLILALALGFAGSSVTAQESSTRTATGDRPARPAAPRLEPATPGGQPQDAETDNDRGPTPPRPEASTSDQPDRQRAHARPETRRARPQSEADRPGPDRGFRERPGFARDASGNDDRPPGRPGHRASRAEAEFGPPSRHAGFATRSEFMPDGPDRPPGPPPLARLRRAAAEGVCPFCGRPLTGPAMAGSERDSLPRAAAGRAGPRRMGRPEFRPEEGGQNPGSRAREEGRQPSPREGFGPGRGQGHDPMARPERAEREGGSDRPAPTHRPQEEEGEE
jgi:hypothetical protein